MFNLGRFNLMRFNVRGDTDEDILSRARMDAQFGAMVSNGRDTYDTAFGQAAVETLTRGAAGCLDRVALAASVGHWGFLERQCQDEAEARASVGFGGALGLTSYPLADGEAILIGLVRLGEDLYRLEDTVGAAFGRRAYMGMNLLPPRAVGEAFFWTQVTTTRFDISYIDIDLTIPRGATLVIDSNSYIVLLDGENVIWTHSGDWLHLSRRTHDVLVQARSGSMTARKEYLYTERWL